MSDDREKVELVAAAIKRVIAGPFRGEPGLFEEAARQAIAAYLNAWRTKEPVSPDPARTHSPDAPLPR